MGKVQNFSAGQNADLLIGRHGLLGIGIVLGFGGVVIGLMFGHLDGRVSFNFSVCVRRGGDA